MFPTKLFKVVAFSLLVQKAGKIQLRCLVLVLSGFLVLFLWCLIRNEYMET